MTQSQYSALCAFIWNIATDLLVYVFDKSEYKKIILPMMVLRRIDVLLEPTKQQVIATNRELERQGLQNRDAMLCQVSGYPFYNTSPFTMRALVGEVNPLRLRANFNEYLRGFSPDVQDIVEKMHLTQVVDNLTEAERLGGVLERFTSQNINLGPLPVLDRDGNELLPALDNHTMGTMFEELLRRFNEENNVTEAGEHFTPRDYVKLLADLAVLPVADQITDNTYSVYDGACGTGGILTIAKERIMQIGRERGKNVKVYIYGQEQAPDTYAICKADLMISGQVDKFHYDHGHEWRDYIAYGSTLSQDGHRGRHFDFCISNPPFGTPWKEDLKRWHGDKARVTDPRFTAPGPDGRPMSLLPDIGDCQMMFLANNLSRMRTDTSLGGTRIVEVHNGSSLFTGAAGSGASNLRRHIIENDLLEAIVAMPENDFYNTGIGTYIWVLTNHKEPRRRGKVQLIDATAIKTPLRKNLGNKNCETNEQNRQAIMAELAAFRDSPISRIFPNQEFGYQDITVQRPLRLTYRRLDQVQLPALKRREDEEWLRRVVTVWADGHAGDEVGDTTLFSLLHQRGERLTSARLKLVRQHLGKRDPRADVCHTVPTDSGSPIEPDPALRDTEQVPLLYPGGIEAFMRNEVLPYAPDAWVDEDKTQVGYELSFTKYFYRPATLRPLPDIVADITAAEGRIAGALAHILDI